MGQERQVARPRLRRNTEVRRRWWAVGGGRQENPVSRKTLAIVSPTTGQRGDNPASRKKPAFPTTHNLQPRKRKRSERLSCDTLFKIKWRLRWLKKTVLPVAL